jgi:hypothetical protein
VEEGPVVSSRRVRVNGRSRPAAKPTSASPDTTQLTLL